MANTVESVASIYADILNQQIKIKGMDRSFLDTIGAFKYGESHFTKTGYARWFNKGALGYKSNRSHMMKFDKSPKADAILKSAGGADLDKTSHLILEHVVPCAYIIKYLNGLTKPITASIILTTHKQMYRRCIITKKEDEHLNSKGYNRTMPPRWNIGDNPYKRYTAVGFTWAEAFN